MEGDFELNITKKDGIFRWFIIFFDNDNNYTEKKEFVKYKKLL
ncbi:hypothetical protein LCGC14_1164010 [marine sediment metagenome]|uniref:Uncharacterized protein n=1 Tax=marine sediment metagenome TaxID=412755 RepID=A0A0F9PA28_9ZZZZ